MIIVIYWVSHHTLDGAFVGDRQDGGGSLEMETLLGCAVLERMHYGSKWKILSQVHTNKPDVSGSALEQLYLCQYYLYTE